MADKVIHGVVRTDKLFGTLNGAGLSSFVHTADMDNGSLVALGAKKDGEREIYNVKVPTATSKIGELYLIAAPEVMYDERLKNLTDFYTPAGTPARGYMLHAGDEYSATADALDGVTAATKVGDSVEVQASLKAKVVATATAAHIGTITAIETVGNLKYYMVRIG